MARWWCAWERRRWVCYLSAWSFRIDFPFFFFFFSFGQRSEIISLVCLFFFLHFYLDVTCWILSLGSFLWQETGRENTFFAESSCPVVGGEKSLTGGVFRSGTKQERDLSAITFVTKALYYQQWDQLNPAASNVPLDRVCKRFRAILRPLQFGSRVHDAVSLREPRDISHPSMWNVEWMQKEGILTTSPLNPLPPASGSVSGGFVITTLPSRLWRSRPSLQLQG